MCPSHCANDGFTPSYHVIIHIAEIGVLVRSVRFFTKGNEQPLTPEKVPTRAMLSHEIYMTDARTFEGAQRANRRLSAACTSISRSQIARRTPLYSRCAYRLRPRRIRPKRNGSTYVHARAAHTVCTRYAPGVRALGGIGVPVCQPSPNKSSAQDSGLRLALMLPARSKQVATCRER